MRRTTFSIPLFVALSFFAGTVRSAEPEQAQTILTAALAKAGASQKTVFLIFHASWCGWCKRLDAALEKPEVRKVIDQYYVVAHLDVLESAARKKELENAGGVEILKKLGGETSGLPFYAFLAPSGKKIGDSNVMPKEQNIGYPSTQEEVAAFEKLLKATSPAMTDQQLAVVIGAVGEKPQQ